MAEMTFPIDIQAQLDAWLASNPDVQKYVTKLWYVPAGSSPPADVTHSLVLRSMTADERVLTIGLVLLPGVAAMVEMFLSLIATQPATP